MQAHISNPFPAAPRGFTLIEALVAIVVVAMVASAAALGVGLASAAQNDAQLVQMATQAAEQQVGFLLEKPYESMDDFDGTEDIGQMLAPPDGGGVTRSRVLDGAWSKLGRQTTLTDEPLTFAQYNSVQVQGTRIDVQVFGPDGTIYAQIRRHRTNEDAE